MRHHRVIKWIGLGLCIVPSSGCYERVVRDESRASVKEPVYQPNASDQPGPIESILYGEQPREADKK